VLKNRFLKSYGALRTFMQNNPTLGKIIKSAALDADIERLISQAYGFASNKDFVRHGGTGSSGIGKEEAEFFLEFSATAIVYIVLIRLSHTPSWKPHFRSKSAAKPTQRWSSDAGNQAGAPLSA